MKIGLEDESVDSSADPAAIGYCFGGVAVLEAVRAGLGLSGVVSFHGLLQTGEDPNPAHFGAVRPPVKYCDNHYNTKTVVLIENGLRINWCQTRAEKGFLKRWMMLASIGFFIIMPKHLMVLRCRLLWVHPGDFTSLPTEDRHKICLRYSGDFS